MAGTNNSSHATGGSSQVNVSTEGNKDANLLQAVLSFAMDIPRVVRASSAVWGVSGMLVIALSAGALYWNLSSTMQEIRESQERIEKSLNNVHNKYNRLARYIRTGDVSALSKERQPSEGEE